MNNTVSPAKLRQMAYDMKQRTGKQIGHCYEAIAQQWGFKTYAALRAAMKEQKQ
jgi:hypothetical protein